MPVFNVYDQHGDGPTIKLPSMNTIMEVRALADAAAARKMDAFYRVFRITDESVTNERFVTAFSVHKGVVREHPEVSFPLCHFGR